MVKVKLYGKLAKFGNEIPLSVLSIPELIRALCVTRAGFKDTLRVGKYHVIVDGVDISQDQVRVNIGENSEVRLIPAVEGGKNGGFLQIVLGAVLIAVGLFAPLPLNVRAALIQAGVAMIIGGVAQMLAPDPPSAKDPTRSENKAFSNIANTTPQGTCVPVTYGTMLVGSKVLSAGLATGEGQEFDLKEAIKTLKVGT